MMFLALILLLLAPLPGVPAPQSRPTEQPSRVAGTRVSLVPPAGFVPSDRFPGYALEEEGASVMVTEFPVGLKEIARSLTDPEQLKLKAMTLLSKETLTVGGAPALLLGLRQSASGADYLKWLLLFGDDDTTLMVTATFPAESERRLSGLLRRNVLTARWDKAAAVADDEGLGYSVDERGALKFAGRLGNGIMFTGGGAFPSKSVDDPLFAAAPSFRQAQAGDEKTFAERRILQTASVRGAVVLKTEPVSIDGLGGFETVAEAKDKATGRPMVVYQAVLFDGRDYYLMQGLISRERAPEHLPSFKEMARSFKRKKP